MTQKRESFLSRSSIVWLPKPFQLWAVGKVRHKRVLNQAVLSDKYDWYEDDARLAQKPPPGDWRVWVLLAGRGFGKTRAGAEYVRAMVNEKKARRIALVAPTALDARSVMVEGESGLLSIGPPYQRPRRNLEMHRTQYSDRRGRC